MKIKSGKYDVGAMATDSNLITDIIPETPPPPPQENGSHANGTTQDSVDGKQNATGDTLDPGERKNGSAMENNNNVNGAANFHANGHSLAASSLSSSPMSKSKKDKRKGKKVSFNVSAVDVQEIPAREDVVEEEVAIEEEKNGVHEEEEEEEEVEETQNANGAQNGHSDVDDNSKSEIEFLRKFANLRKLGQVMEERSQRQKSADQERINAEFARAREILQTRARREELARLIPSEELERLLGALNMTEEHVVPRTDCRKFRVSTRQGKTSFIYLAGKGEDGNPDADELEVAEVEEEVEIVQSEDTFSQTFGMGGDMGLL